MLNFITRVYAETEDAFSQSLYGVSMQESGMYRLLKLLGIIIIPIILIVGIVIYVRKKKLSKK